MSELKPCPFCGGEAKFLNSWLSNYRMYAIGCAGDGEQPCPSCNWEQDEQGGFGCEFATKEEAIQNWNTRPLEDTLRAEVTAIKMVICELRDQKAYLQSEVDRLAAEVERLLKDDNRLRGKMKQILAHAFIVDETENPKMLRTELEIIGGLASPDRMPWENRNDFNYPPPPADCEEVENA